MIQNPTLLELLIAIQHVDKDCFHCDMALKYHSDSSAHLYAAFSSIMHHLIRIKQSLEKIDEDWAKNALKELYK